MAPSESPGWSALFEGFPWFQGEGSFPLPAYSEFMPAPRLGRRPYGESDPGLFSEDDPFGWNVTEIEEDYEIRPGLRHIGPQIIGSLVRLQEGGFDPHLAGHKGQNLVDNPYWPAELAALAGKLPRERYVVLAPLALSRTQDDKGRIRWTLFGSSEMGPETAFWRSYPDTPDAAAAGREARTFLVRLLEGAYGQRIASPSDLRAAGFRILPRRPDAPHAPWREDPLPSWTRDLIAGDADDFLDVRYLLTFRPFGDLPSAVRDRYAAGLLALLPYPGSLIFWGVAWARRVLPEFPFAFQLLLQRVVARRESAGGLRVPQSGWLHEPVPGGGAAEIHPDLVVNAARRRHRFQRVARYAEEASDAREDRVARILFSTKGDQLGLYGKPMARNCQLLTEDGRILLDGPRAARKQIYEARHVVDGGGLFRYRFQFPAMRVGRHEIYWHRPLVAFRPGSAPNVEVLADGPLGVLTAYPADAPDPGRATFLRPRLLRRDALALALHQFEREFVHYARQTALNVQALWDAHGLWGGRRLPRSFARNLLRVAEDERLSQWLAALPGRAAEEPSGKAVRDGLEAMIEPPRPDADRRPAAAGLPAPLTLAETGTREFEASYWEDILHLSDGRYVETDNADPAAPDAAPEPHPQGRRPSDLKALGDYLLNRHQTAISAAGLAGKAVCGSLPFSWETDFDFPLFGGWDRNRNSEKPSERDLLVLIPGRNRGEAVILADHFDTAYMEDLYEGRAGAPKGTRRAATGADDNHSATAALLRAAPIFLKMSREDRLERDIWLLHLTGEEFPADCLGARHFVRCLVERTLRLGVRGGGVLDLSAVRVAGVFVMDMIAHNREVGQDIFQISPGRGPASLRLAYEAHLANRIWNAWAVEKNRETERCGCGRGLRNRDGRTIPETALHARLAGEVRTWDDPRSSLYNTDGQIFSDAGVPVVLFMENYDIDRAGYHDEHDTMENIDLDYGAALAAIAIESTARAAAAADLADLPPFPGG